MVIVIEKAIGTSNCSSNSFSNRNSNTNTNSNSTTALSTTTRPSSPAIKSAPSAASLAFWPPSCQSPHRYLPPSRQPSDIINRCMFAFLMTASQPIICIKPVLVFYSERMTYTVPIHMQTCASGYVHTCTSGHHILHQQ